MKILTDEKLINQFLDRGAQTLIPDRDSLKKKLLSGERLRAYQGYDPTGPYLHIGHAMGMRAMRILQQLGHEVIFLVGDYTSKVGDPDKDSGRKIMSDEEISANMNGWKEQAAQIIDFEGDNPVQFKHNHDWLSKLNFNDVIELMSHITVQRMIERDMFERRLKMGDPIGLQEFIYPLMQGYDSVAMDIDIEVAGNDQLFNMLVGRDLVKSYLKKEKFIRTNQLMDAPEGRTMSKTKGNGINLADSPTDMYGKAMSYPDTHIVIGLELLTELPMNEIKEVEAAMKQGENPKQFKELLAFEIVKMFKGEAAASEAQAGFNKVFSAGENPEEMAEIEVRPSEMKLVDLVVASKLVNSSSDARRMIQQKAVKIDKEVHDDINEMIAVTSGMVIQVGKRRFAKVK